LILCEKPCITSDIEVLKSYYKKEFNEYGLIQLIMFSFNTFPFFIYDNIYPLISSMTLDITTFESSRKPDYSSVSDDFEIFIDRHPGRRKYVMYSGGIDSSIVMNAVSGPDTIAACSVYSAKELPAFRHGLSYFRYSDEVLIYPDTDEYLDILDCIDFRLPFINTGVVDDYQHILMAERLGTEVLYTGIGADEILGDYAICHDSFPECYDDYCNLFGNVRAEVMNALFDRNKLEYVYKKTMENFSDKTFRDRIDFIENGFLLYNQIALIENNNKTGVIRVNPFLCENLRRQAHTLKDELFEYNGIEKFILRLIARDTLPGDLYSIPSRDFIIDYSLFDKNRLLSQLRSLNSSGPKLMIDNPESLNNSEIMYFLNASAMLRNFKK
ncbi:MAG: asparagine synthase-related protein, partial [Candidatus Muiribacteriaceae bacterium]